MGVGSKKTLKAVIDARLYILAHYEQELDSLREDEEIVKEQLLASAPVNIVKFIREENMINNLLHIGASKRRVDLHNNMWSLEKADDVKKLFLPLEKAWNNSIKLSFEGGRDFIQVIIKVIL